MPEVEVVQPTALQAIQRAEIDSMIATAKQYPRENKVALKRVEDMATLTEEIAEECHYSLPKTDKDGRRINIQGPSIRFAELLASQWGNLRIASRVTDIGSKQLCAQGICLDLETNVGYDNEVRRSIVSKKGRRFSEDVITSNANAAAAIGRRNAILSAIPRPLWWPIYEKTLARIGGGGTPITESWQKAVQWFGSRGVDEKTLRAAINIKSPRDLKQGDIQTLRGWRNAIEQDASSIEEIFSGFVAEREKEAPEPKTKPAKRKAPEEVGDEAGDDEIREATAKLLNEWKGMRKTLTLDEADECRESAGIGKTGFVGPGCNLAQLEALIRKAEEIAQVKRE